jgi:hypothetical protein
LFVTIYDLLLLPCITGTSDYSWRGTRLITAVAFVVVFVVAFVVVFDAPCVASFAVLFVAFYVIHTIF